MEISDREFSGLKVEQSHMKKKIDQKDEQIKRLREALLYLECGLYDETVEGYKRRVSNIASNALSEVDSMRGRGC